MRRLRERFPRQLVILGVHAPKFTAERGTSHLREAVRRLGLAHAIVNDRDHRIWQSYAVRAWPTVVIVDPEGRVIAQKAGEIDPREVGSWLEERIAAFEQTKRLSRRAPPLAPEHAGERARRLSFPSKLYVLGRALYVADTGRHRILELALDEDFRRARRERTFGTGRPGLADGPRHRARFHAPRGLAVRGFDLIVADTENHALRAIALASGEVRTIAGTGELARRPGIGGRDARAVALRSPWDVLAVDELLFVAMAGSHQVWAMLPSGAFGVYAGTGAEALFDGPRRQATFNQPSGLAEGLAQVFVADAEASAIRLLTFDDEPAVATLVGRGLFEWGDADGPRAKARLQHPTGLAFGDGTLYVADSYNHKIKTVHPNSGEVRTLFGTGEPGLADGSFSESRLWEPDGLAWLPGYLFIADTNNHAVRVADLERRELWTLEIR